jgi:hypothetical protein
MQEVNEKCTAIITAAFVDENGDDVTPDSGTYEIHDVATGTEILAATALPSLAASIDITVTAAQNALTNTNKRFEKHRMTVKYVYSTTKAGTAEFDWLIKNLSQVT